MQIAELSINILSQVVSKIQNLKFYFFAIHLDKIPDVAIVVPVGEIGGNCAPKSPKFGKNQNFSGSDKEIFEKNQNFLVSDRKY